MEQLNFFDKPKKYIYVIKFTLPNGRSHYGVSDYIKFTTYEEALLYCEEQGRRDPDCGFSIETLEIK